MSSLTRIGGVSSLICAATYIVGFALLFTVLAESGLDAAHVDPARFVAFLVDNAAMTRVWYLVIYVVNALFLVVLAVALSERIGAAEPGFGRLVLAFGLVWATLVLGAGMMVNVGISQVLAINPVDPTEAVRIWQVTELVEAGIGGGNEIAGGTWALVIGLTGLATGRLPGLLCWWSLVIGVAGLSTIAPPLAELGGAVFGLGYIAWFVWTGVVLIRN